MGTNIDKLLELARQKTVTNAERETQRQSFAYGNANLSDVRVTRDTVKQEAERLATNPVVITTGDK